VRFDANVAGGLPWRFEPEQNSVEVKIGEVVTVSYRVVNESARDTVGVASYNVSPPTAGAYFSKINCFCFTDQRLKPGEKRDMTVVFFVAPELVKDSEQDGLDAITLSYTMYPARQAQTPQGENGAGSAPGRS
jgi:cytochrome c oxidase assembly protein subunit 11